MLQQITDVEARLVELAALVPDLARKMGTMKAEMLIRLLSDTEVTPVHPTKMLPAISAAHPLTG